MSDDKIYHNITITYNDCKLISDERMTSAAEANVEVLDPLITKTKDYDICISKFRIDTQTIPLVIPELKQPQIKKDSKIELNYWVKLMSLKPSQTDKNKSDHFITRQMKYLYLIGKRWDTSINKTDLRAAYTALKPVKRKVMVTEKDPNDETKEIQVEKAYLDNLDPFCYIYEPQEFVDSMNNAIAETLKDFGIENDNLGNTAFFCLEGGKLTYYQHSNAIFVLVFSDNLYKYFGLGFNTKRVPSENGWTIAIDKATRTPCFKDDDNRISKYGNSDNANGVENANVVYNTARNQFSVTQTWTCCKSILICSYVLPVKGEYVPTAENDGMLFHENSKACKRTYEEFHAGDDKPCNIGDVDLLTPTQKVLESFYPVPVEGGDIRTGVIYSNDSMDVSTKLAFNGDFTQVQKFDIAVKWLDIYNNLHTLELKEGSSCDIRIAFVKKSVKQDLVLNGFTRVLDALNYKPPPPNKKPFRIIPN